MADGAITGLHVGRHWPGEYRDKFKGLLEDECPCPKEPCGLVDSGKADPDCPQHGPGTEKTMRSMHSAEDCPGHP
jgi:hypothetical protein